MNTGVKSAGGFKMLVGIVPYGGNPAISGVLGTPRKLRQTVTTGPVMTDAGSFANGMLSRPLTGPTQATGTFTVADNSFPAPAELILGTHRLVNSFDYLIGADTAHTATNIAAAISLLPGFSAVAVASVVTVSYSHQADDTPFFAIHYGTVTSFNTFTGAGFLTRGTPIVGPPVIT